MPARDTIPQGAPCWVDLTTSDADTVRAFYGGLFGWTFEEPNPEFGGYFNFLKDGVRIGGCMVAQPGMVADVWSIYLSTDDANKTLEAVAAEGGTVIVEPMAVGEFGTMAFIGDSTGAAIGIWQPGTQHGFGVTGEPGTPAWFELFTRDYEKSLDFYRSALRWETETMADGPELRYTLSKHGDEQLAGVMDASAFLPEGIPNHWSVYIEVTDADATVARATELGGSVVSPPQDSPYGRFVTLADPRGAAFKIIASTQATPGP